MIRRLAALILLSTLSQTSDISRQIPLTVANLGENFTMSCPESKDQTGLFFMYKMKFGYMADTVLTGSYRKSSLTGQFDSSRFAVTNIDGLYSLTITNVSKEDEATYFCQAGGVYAIEFTNGTVLIVKDQPNQQKSVHVQQTPKTGSVRTGELMTLQCSLLSKNEENKEECPGGHSVYWFRAGSGKSHPSVFYTHGQRSDEAQKRSCVYSLSKTMQESDVGTFYCAVDICGEILHIQITLCVFVVVLLPLSIVIS
uniref:Ig-like domain-containing protein n=1 Tax=Mola mola TaxID=94237 RepID=A0A3Q3VRS3_MOLML